MANYRLYLIGAAGHVERVEEIVADDDEAACKASASGRDGKRRELWCGGRFVDEWKIAAARALGNFATGDAQRTRSINLGE